MKLTFDLDFDSILAGVEGVSERASDMTPLMEGIGRTLLDSTRDRINATNLAPDGTPWKPSLRALTEGGPTLNKTQRLRDSIVTEVGRTSVEIGSNLIYAGIHQHGGRITPKNGKALSFRLASGAFATVGAVDIPARPFLGVSENDEADIVDLTRSFFTL